MMTVIEFPEQKPDDDEHERRVIEEVKRLAGLASVDWVFQLKKSAPVLGIDVGELEKLVKAEIADRKKAKVEAEAEERRLEQRAAKERQRTEAAERAKRKAEQDAIDKAEKEKQKAKAKALADIAKLPVVQQEMKLIALATQLNLDLSELREEFAELIKEDKKSSEPSLWDVEPWAQPVSTAAVLSALVGKFNKHIAAEPHEIITFALWAMSTWVYQETARHSTFLVLTSADPIAGKTTALEVLNFTVLRPSLDTDITGPSLYRFVDQMKPTLLMDEAEDLLKLRDVKSIILKSHSRDGTIKRQERIGGRFITVQFSPWCPKAFALVGLNLPPAMISRSIIIQLWAKLPDSKIAFDHCDDEEFASLRRKLARWAADHLAKLKSGKKPLFPAGFDNRRADLWRLLLLIAELAGADWAGQARKAAERLSHSRSAGNWRTLLLRTIAKMAADGRKYLLSEDLNAELLSDPTGPWSEYENKRGRVGKITQRQIAHLFESLQIFPTLVSPRRLRGYRLADFSKAFAHYRIPILSTSPRKKSSPRKKGERKRGSRTSKRRSL
jgi:Protein of unknown function (DUF3631)